MIFAVYLPLKKLGGFSFNEEKKFRDLKFVDPKKDDGKGRSSRTGVIQGKESIFLELKSIQKLIKYEKISAIKNSLVP